MYVCFILYVHDKVSVWLFSSVVIHIPALYNVSNSLNFVRSVVPCFWVINGTSGTLVRRDKGGNIHWCKPRLQETKLCLNMHCIDYEIVRHHKTKKCSHHACGAGGVTTTEAEYLPTHSAFELSCFCFQLWIISFTSYTVPNFTQLHK